MFLFNVRLWLIKQLIGHLSVIANVTIDNGGRSYVGSGWIYNSAFGGNVPDRPLQEYCGKINAPPFTQTHVDSCVFL